MNRETRRHHATEVRATEENGAHYITLKPIAPYVADDYGSVWMPDTFDASCAERMPTLAWCHSWSDPIGRACEYTPGADGPTIKFRLDDFDAVPQARRAYAQCQPGPNGEPATIDDCSVGFSDTTRRDPTDAEVVKWPGCREVIEQSGLDEVSLVLRGAVPGAKVVGVRNANGTRSMVDTDLVVELAKKVAAGDLTEAEAQVAITLAAGDPIAPEVDGDDDEVVDAELVEVDADEALALLERSAW